jgi:ketosteroid isomerase-like protein
MIDADSTTLDKIIDNDLSYGHSGGKIESKASFITNIMNGNSDFVSIDLTNQSIMVKGQTAIVRHTLSAATNDKGTPGTVKLSVLLVWSKEGKEWKLIARQAVKA